MPKKKKNAQPCYDLPVDSSVSVETTIRNEKWFDPVQIYFWNGVGREEGQDNFISLFLLPILFPYKYIPRDLEGGGNNPITDDAEANVRVLFAFYKKHAAGCKHPAKTVDDLIQQRLRLFFDQNEAEGRNVVFFQKALPAFLHEKENNALLEHTTLLQTNPRGKCSYLIRIDKKRNTKDEYPVSKKFLNGFLSKHTEVRLQETADVYACILQYFFMGIHDELRRHTYNLYKDLEALLSERNRTLLITDEELTLLTQNDTQQETDALPLLAGKLLIRAFLIYALNDYKKKHNKSHAAEKDYLDAVSSIRQEDPALKQNEEINKFLYTLLFSDQPLSSFFSKEKICENFGRLPAFLDELSLPYSAYTSMLKSVLEKLYDHFLLSDRSDIHYIALLTDSYNKLYKKDTEHSQNT